MSPDHLLKWIKNPALLDRDSLHQLKVLLEEYPCFTAARILYLKNLLSVSDLHFSKELIRTAISVPDRRRLYYFIEDKPLPGPVYAHENEQSVGEGFSIIDRFLHSTATDTVSADLKDRALSVPEPEEQNATSLSEIKDVLSADSVSLFQNESSFSLDYVSYLNQSIPSDDNAETSMHGQDLIDAFLTNSSEPETRSPRLKHEASESDVEISDTNLSVVDLPEDTFTETLAKIYLKQKRYDHALEIFRSLSLKYPEKNVYFADQIRFLEKLIINIKNN